MSGEGEVPQWDEQLRSAVKDKELMLALLKSEAWASLAEVLRARRTALEQQVLHKCLEDGNSAYRQEFMKGQAYQLLLVEQLPEMLLSSSEQVIEAVTPDTEDGDTDG